MSDFSLDDPGFKAPSAPPPAPPSSDSSSETPPDVRRNCIACPRRMSKKTADRHTLCVSSTGLIAMLIPVARSAWSGRRRKCDFMRSIASLSNQRLLLNRSLLLRLLFLLTPCTLRSLLRTVNLTID